MVEHYDAQVGRVFHALSHEARRKMLVQLSRGNVTVSDLAEPHQMSLAAASKHIRVLEEAGLLKRRVVGRQHICSLDASPLASADQWLSFYRAFWPARLDALAALIEPQEKKEE